MTAYLYIFNLPNTLERIYGIYNGNHKNKDENNFVPNKSQSDLATQIGIDQRQLQNYKKLSNLIPELQSLVENEDLKATTAYKIWAKMSAEEEQKKFLREIGEDKISEMTQKQTQQYILEKKQLEEKTKTLEESNKVLEQRYNELSQEL